MTQPEIIIEPEIIKRPADAAADVAAGLFVAKVADATLPLSDVGRVMAFASGVVLARMVRDWLNKDGAKK